MESHTVDMGAAAELSAAQTHHSPTLPTNPTHHQQPDFTFLDFQHTQSQDVSGSISPQGDIGGGFSRKRKLKAGKAGRFLDNRGFGWLMEVEDEEDGDAQRPLFLKLGIVRDAPDFWGPLFVVVMFALVSLMGQLGAVSWILTIWFAGSFVIFFLARVLGGEVGYAQCLGVIGYCLLPLVATGALAPLLSAMWRVLETPVRLLGLAWAVYSAGTLLCVQELGSKRPLLLYPVFLLYLYFLSVHTGV